MTYQPRIRIIDHAFHLNGIFGMPFRTVMFHDLNDKSRRMLGILFTTTHHSAIFDLDQLARGDITLGSKSFQGDIYERPLRRALKRLTRNRRYEVQTEMFGTWENCWTNDDGLPITFATFEAAETAMNDHIIDCEDAVEGGYLSDAPNPSSLRVMPVRFA